MFPQLLSYLVHFAKVVRLSVRVSLRIVVAVVDLCQEIAQDRFGVGDAYAVVLVGRRSAPVSVGKVSGVASLVVDDIRIVEVLVCVFAHRAVHPQTDIASARALDGSRSKPRIPLQPAVEHKVSAHVVVVAFAPVLRCVLIDFDVIANHVHLIERVVYTILIRVVIEGG